MKSEITKKGIERATHRALYYAMGYSPEDLKKPIVGLVNSRNECMPGHMQLDLIARAVREGIIEAGGMPVEFPTIGICDGIAQGNFGMHYPLASRELIADTIEVMMNAHSYDAMVLVTNCDKITPGMLMAAIRLDVPAILVSGGPMATGYHKGKAMGYSDLMFSQGLVAKKEMSEAQLAEMERDALPGCGACNLLGTANSMNYLTEALGMCLPGSATPAASGRRIALARDTGRKIMELLKKGITPRQIVTHEALENAVVLDLAQVPGRPAPVLPHAQVDAHAVGQVGAAGPGEAGDEEAVDLEGVGEQGGVRLRVRGRRQDRRGRRAGCARRSADTIRRISIVPEGSPLFWHSLQRPVCFMGMPSP